MVPLFGVLIEHQVTTHDVGVVTGKLCFDKGLCNVLPVFCNEHQAGHRCTDIFCDFKIVGEHSVAEQLTADPVGCAAGNIQQILQLIRLHLMLDHNTSRIFAEEFTARLHYEKVQRLKLQGFTDWAMQHWTFANDHGQNPQMQLAQRYVAHWPEMREKNVGLLLWGGVGTGKSFMAGCIANALMEQEVAVCMTNFARIMNELNNAFSGRNEVVDRLCGYPLLVIDDFGMERGTEYALEQIYNIIDSRYRSRKPLIVTTNLTLTELKNPQDTAHARIYDRLLELCTPIACTGPSMRKDIGQAKLNLLKTLLA